MERTFLSAELAFNPQGQGAAVLQSISAETESIQVHVWLLLNQSLTLEAAYAPKSC
ncbi:hypothetical protein Cadr_000019408 [Camelus dromedarius]|uniref:Uncharacterized protein n=1 Tax=Camelus dromedarius TaxID=9838 RepID=A0A5N4D2H0_CAMDR|nr:hypothetical protein Cadr_000019408 [Camelus dromedarius]